MPIDIDRFEEGSVEDLRASGRTNAEEILTFLAASPEQAFTPKEIHDGTDILRGSVGVVLSRLEDRGLVRHRGEYWAIADVEDIGTTLSALSTARAMSDRFGPEDPAEWGPGVDDRTGDE
ncbi:MAG: MarR family transcriptional regulator [Halorientalis sp.]